MPGIEVHYHDVEDDIVSDDNKYNFTDGCGQMSLEFALELKKHLYLNYTPSAIQFRFPGFKGVLVLDQNLFEYQILFRRSQQKYFPYLNGNNFLDVIKVSRPAGCRMNKTYIEIWCQNAAKHGQEIENRVKNRIEQYYEETLQSLIEKLLDPTKFGEALELLPKYMDCSKMRSFTPETFQSEPFFRQLVQSNVIMELKFVAEKQQINIPKNFGRTAIGVADFTRRLKEGEVYFCYSESLNSKCKAKFIVSGPVAIIRSPALSLGDLQFVTAVDCPELHHLENVLVFSTYGDRPIQDKLSGGDLDGDEYVIIWDPELILPFSHPAAEFVQPKPEESKIIEIDDLQDKFPEFRKEYMRNDNVGYISNNLAILGELLGYDNKGVVKLAEKTDQAVLYFKSGIPSPGLENHEKSSFDPAHMKKDQKPMYCLENVIGGFHSKSQSIVDDIKQIQEFDESLPEIDELIHLDGWEEYEEAAMIFFDAFKLQVNELLIQYGIQSTGELFSNQIFSLSLRGFETEKESVTSPLGCLQQKVFTLMKNLRTKILNQFVQNWEQLKLLQEAEFFDFYLPEVPEKLKKFAVACYKIAYENGDYLAFPWSLWDVIDDIRCTNQLNSSQQSMNSTVVDGFYANDSNNLTRWINNFQKHYNVEVNFKYYFYRFLNINRMTITDDWQKFTKFLWHYGTKEYDDFKKNPELKRFVKACRWLLFKLAFEISPKVFTTPHRMDETSNALKIARFAFELESLLNSATLPTRLAEQLLRLTNCSRIIISQPIDRNFSKIFQVLALGTKDAIEDLRNLLTIEINKSNVLNAEESHQIKVRFSSTKIMQILHGMNPSRVD
uniref:RNA-dependent RNA polymerase n=1 Tax=Panagrolaimus sp. JU765 TaxID=591449 RepID=A0AC34QDD6_9BILA